MNVKRLRLDDAIARAQEAEELAGPEVDPYEGWSEARIKAWKNREKNENQYYYRFNEPGEKQANGKWTPEEHQRFMDILASLPDGKANYEWGTFSKSIKGRVGYQCSNYYRTLVKNQVILDENYMLDPVSGELRFNFKNKGFTRAEPVPGEPRMVMVKKVIKPKKPKAAPKPKASKPKKKKLSEGDKAFHCNVKLGDIRRSGRRRKRHTPTGVTSKMTTNSRNFQYYLDLSIPSRACPSKSRQFRRSVMSRVTKRGAESFASRGARYLSLHEATAETPRTREAHSRKYRGTSP